MSNPVQHSNDRVTQAMEEATVRTVIALYDRGAIFRGYTPCGRRGDLRHILTEFLKVPVSEADNWLNQFMVEPVSAPQSQETNP